MNICWVQNLETVLNGFIAEMKVVVLDFKGFFKITQSWSKLLCSSEDASEVIVSDSSVLVSLVRQGLCLSQQLQGNVEVFYWRLLTTKNYLPFCRKLMLSMLQIMAASWLDFMTASLLSPYSSFCIIISSSNFFRASRYFFWWTKMRHEKRSTYAFLESMGFLFKPLYLVHQVTHCLL